MYLRLAAPLFVLAACAGAPEAPPTDADLAGGAMTGADMAGAMTGADMPTLNLCRKGFMFLSGSPPVLRIAGVGQERVTPPLGDPWYTNMVSRSFSDAFSQSGIGVGANLSLDLDAPGRKLTVSGGVNAAAPAGPVVVVAQGKLTGTLELCDQQALGKTYTVTADCSGEGVGRTTSASLKVATPMGVQTVCEWNKDTNTWTSPGNRTFQVRAPQVQPPEIPGPSRVQLFIDWEASGGGTMALSSSVRPTIALTVQ